MLTCPWLCAEGWPKVAQSIVQRAPGGGLAVVVYAPANASDPTVGGGAHVSITTDYPFSDVVELRVASARPFPLHLRIPAWVEGATVSVNEAPAEHATPGSFFTTSVGPRSVVVLSMQNEIRVETGYNDSSVSVHRGPLLFAMDIGARSHFFVANATFPTAINCCPQATITRL